MDRHIYMISINGCLEFRKHGTADQDDHYYYFLPNSEIIVSAPAPCLSSQAECAQQCPAMPNVPTAGLGGDNYREALLVLSINCIIQPPTYYIGTYPSFSLVSAIFLDHHLPPIQKGYNCMYLHHLQFCYVLRYKI